MDRGVKNKLHPPERVLTFGNSPSDLLRSQLATMTLKTPVMEVDEC
jgi:hypothetical protein